MIDCPIFFVNPGDLVGGASVPPSDPPNCNSCCNCGYVQYEGLLPYLGEIQHYANGPDTEKSDQFEFRLREQLLEISRLFDHEAGVKPGYFSKAHSLTTKTFPTNGSSFIKIPDFVPGTLEVRNMKDQLINPATYGVRDGYLEYHPCQKRYNAYCTSHCGCKRRRHRETRPWPEGCYQVTARFGKECADVAVQMAIRDYLIEKFRLQDVGEATANGFPISRTFKVPYSWSSYISTFKNRRHLFSGVAFA